LARIGIYGTAETNVNRKIIPASGISQRSFGRDISQHCIGDAPTQFSNDKNKLDGLNLYRTALASG